MVACLLNGCPDTDVVLSEADLTDVISCLAGQTGEDLYDERPADLKIECESYDLRVGERASNKRQRSAGNAAQAALDSARGTRSQGRKGEGLPKKEPLPPGWVAKIITIEDGRRCECTSASGYVHVIPGAELKAIAESTLQMCSPTSDLPKQQTIPHQHQPGCTSVQG